MHPVNGHQRRTYTRAGYKQHTVSELKNNLKITNKPSPCVSYHMTTRCCLYLHIYNIYLIYCCAIAAVLSCACTILHLLVLFSSTPWRATGPWAEGSSARCRQPPTRPRERWLRSSASLARWPRRSTFGRRPTCTGRRRATPTLWDSR